MTLSSGIPKEFIAYRDQVGAWPLVGMIYTFSEALHKI